MTNKRKPRIAIIGNMNNNGFSLLRYFRDLGADAYLLTFSTDGVGNLSHFSPEADTWDIDNWKAFIRPLGMPNNSRGILMCLLSRFWPSKLKKNLLSQYDLFCWIWSCSRNVRGNEYETGYLLPLCYGY